MPASILDEAAGLVAVAAPRRAAALSVPAVPAVSAVSPLSPVPSEAITPLLTCPSCGSSHVAQVLGDNGGVSYVCTACGRSWS
ncbi:hypothetical protein AB0Q95_15510 [Streptomyces sp. NPDC059900]|uniref:hypothetical protein n=1 Tax=Streptomyces sp. NPDC059900 TaxID=3155816 RepID=UPI0034441783